MSFNNLTTADYKALYAKYLTRDNLLKFLLIKPGQNVLDLCAGLSLRTAKFALEKGAKVTAVDKAYCDGGNYLSMWNDKVDGPSTGLRVIGSDVNEILPYLEENEYDWIICQQGINYCFSETVVTTLAKTLKPEGRFVFNTFNTKPPEKPTFREYEIDGVHFGEAYYMVNGWVHHWQMRQGMVPHLTKFRWIPPEEFDRVLKRYFKITIWQDGPTDTYVCESLS